jgi:hypothetical protein
MLNKHKYALVIIIVVFLAILGYFGYKKFIASSTPFGSGGAYNPVFAGDGAANKNTMQPNTPAQACPQAGALSKQGDRWVTPDGKWKNFTPSTANKVLGFLGAQWAGVKVGTIICLYQTDEAVSFPLAVEQTSSQSILEPDKLGWGALVNNRRFCKSASVADCVYFAEPSKDVVNVYQEIKYNPSAAQAGD